MLLITFRPAETKPMLSVAEIYNIMTIIETLKDKRKSFIGVNSNKIDYARNEGFKEGLDWAISTIEDWNDWIRFDGNESDLPKQKVWLFNEINNDLFIGELFDLDGFPIHRFCSHYQLLKKPKKPNF